MAVKVQHLRSTTASKRPTAAALLAGEVALNTDSGTPGAFFEDGGGGIVKIGPAEVGSSAPNALPAAGGSTGNTTGELWYDTANASGNSADLLKVFDGSSFVSAGTVTLGSTAIPLGSAAATTIAGLTELNSTIYDCTNQGVVRFEELTANGSHFIGFKAPASVTASVTFTLPDGDGSSAQTLTTDGSGTLSWADPAGATVETIASSTNSTHYLTFVDSNNVGTAASETIYTQADINYNPSTSVLTVSGSVAAGALSLNAVNVTSTAAEINVLDGIPATLTATELGYVDGVTSAIQTQIDAKQATVTGGQSITMSGATIDADFAAAAGSSSASNAGVASFHSTYFAADASGFVTPTGTFGLTTVTTDSGSVAPSGNGITITGADGITVSGTGATVTVDLDDTAVTASTYGSATQTGTFTVDAQGRLTSAANTTIAIPHTQITDFDAGVQANTLNDLAVPDGAVAMNSQKITGLADPTLDQDAATKIYVDNTAQGLDVKGSCDLATTANITLSGTQTIDGVAAVADDRILVKNQTDASENGIYVVASGAWSRSDDADTWAKLVSAFVFVSEGSTNADNGYTCTVDAGGTLGTTDITWSQFSGAGQVIAGTGMTKSGNTLNVIGTADKITANADAITIASTYVGQTSITTLGTITTGSWNGSAVGLTYGGTGADATGIALGKAFMGPSGGSGNASFREILCSDIAPTTGGSFDAGSY